MSRTVLFVWVLLATGGVVGADAPEAPPAEPTAAEPQVEEIPSVSRADSDPTEDQAGEDTPEAESDASAEESDEEEGPTLAATPGGPGLGMSILGNQEAPKSLVIVPWKSSEIGESLGIATLLDESRQPIDREVFMRALTYYEIRSERTP